ncbi:MAG: crotonase/enoyl-CoA hydratase family protein [Alphaproteobacteria bacterium]|nr:crotonase/enoyl-CoA hydratase family protein [Alphaproteobacteria bacterium]
MSIEVERDGAVWTVTIDNPAARNAVDRAHADALASAFRAFDTDAAARAAVLTGSGGHFCAGADLKAVVRRDGSENRLSESGDGPMGPSRLLLSKPVIAAVAGYAVAGGLELSLWCDLRVVDETAVFGVFSRRFGIPLVDGGTVRLPRLVGMGRALDMILTGRAVGAAEALAIGLANRVVPRGEAKTAAQALAHQIAQFPQSCLLADRRSAYEQWELGNAEAIANEFRLGKAVLDREWDTSARAFVQGRGRGGAPA